MHVSFIFVIKRGENFRVFPVDGAVAMAGMFRYARYVFICFTGGYIIFMLSHTSFEINAGLSNIFSFWIAAACLLVDTLFFEGFWLSFVGATKKIS